MAGYTRNDTGNNIANGNVINASDLDGEFDALVAAFHASTGHVHDGTAANGAPITKVGPAQEITVSGSAVLPSADNTIDLGSSTYEFKDLYIDGTANIDSLVADTADINGGTIDGVTIGTNSVVTDLRVDNLKLDGNVVSSTNTNGNIEVTPNGTGTVIISKVAISAGAIDATTIGTTTAAAGTFTTLTSTGNTTIGDASGDTLTVNATPTMAVSPILSDLTASKPVFTDASKKLTSSGTLLTDQGGTGLASYTAGDLVYYASGTALTKLAVGTNNYVLTSSGSAPQWTANTGTGNVVRASSPTLTTPTIGAATATTVNNVAFTAPASTATLTLGSGKTVTVNNTLTLSGTDSTTMTFPSTSTTVAGLGIAQTFTQDQTIAANLTLNGQGDLRFADGDSSNWVAFQAPSTVASNVTWTLPSVDGSTGQALVTNGSGTLSWATPGGAPGGSNTQIQFNNSSSFGGSANFTWDGTNVQIGATGALRFADTDSSNYVAFKAAGTVASNVTWTLPATDGTSNQALVTNGSGTLSWATPGGTVTISNDTSTASDLYPAFTAATSGTVSTIYTGNANLLYKPSTGELKAQVPVALNGLIVNSQTVAANYTVAAGYNALSAGPVSVNSGITVTVSSGSVWTVV